MFCPKCGCEYRDGFAKCIDCDEELVKRKPKFIAEKEKEAASFTRVIATVIDLLAIGAAITALYYFNKFITRFEVGEVSETQVFILFLLIWWVYSAIFESSKFKGTIGKSIFRICVVDSDYFRVSFFRATIRFVLKVLLGSFILRAMVNEKPIWHDSISDTMVIYKKYSD